MKRTGISEFQLSRCHSFLLMSVIFFSPATIVANRSHPSRQIGSIGSIDSITSSSSSNNSSLRTIRFLSGGRLRKLTPRGEAGRYGVQDGPLKTLLRMLSAFFASMFNPFYMIDIPSSIPTAGQGILFPNKVDDNASVSGSSSSESKKRGEKKIYGRNHKGERQELKIRTLADLYADDA